MPNPWPAPNCPKEIPLTASGGRAWSEYSSRPGRRDLILALLIFSAAVAAFSWIAANIESGSVLTSIDQRVVGWLHAHATPAGTKAMIIISFLGAPSTLTAITAVVGMVLVRMRRYDRLLAMVTLVLGGNLLNYGVKHLVHRGRPIVEDPLLTLPSYSFPSGHAMASTVFYGFVITWVLMTASQRYHAASAAGVSMIGLVCFSRVYLGVHYASDVLGGILEAVAWSILALAALSLASVHWPSGLSGRQAE